MEEYIKNLEIKVNGLTALRQLLFARNTSKKKLNKLQKRIDEISNELETTKNLYFIVTNHKNTKNDLINEEI